MKIGSRDFVIGKKTYIMGILNVTPDSFSDGGQFNSVERALKHAMEMIEQGADILDIGGESTRPNYTPVNDEEEINRVVPVIKAIREQTDIPISIDTHKSRVAEAAIKAGADIINDVWGFKKDPDMAMVASEYNVVSLLMHNRDSNIYYNFMEEMLTDLRESIDIALKAGVSRDKIIIDPGIGFAKDYEKDLTAINHLDMLKSLGYPILLACSKKRVIGNTLNLDIENRVEGTLATTVIGIMKGCDFVRVHNVLENKRAAMMADALLRR